MRTSAAIVLAIALSLVVGSGCPPPSSGRTAGYGAPKASATSLTTTLPRVFGPADDRVQRVYSERFGLSIPLPDPDGWVVAKQRSSFLLLDHEASDSRIAARLWREDDNVNRRSCEQSARELRELPKRSGTLISRGEALDFPTNFDTHVDVGFVATQANAHISGYLLAFGGWARRCFAFVFTTQARGAEAERLVGERLAIVQSYVLPRLERRRETQPQGRMGR